MSTVELFFVLLWIRCVALNPNYPTGYAAVAHESQEHYEVYIHRLSEWGMLGAIRRNGGNQWVENPSDFANYQ